MSNQQRDRRPVSFAADLHGIRVELRAIFRQYADLRKPLNRFDPHPLRVEGEPRFFVAFDRHDHRDISGLRVKCPKIILPDERIQDGVLRFAESVWHLKDRLKRLGNRKSNSTDIEAAAKGSDNLILCADLANAKKHGESRNRSGLNPRLGVLRENPVEGVVEFDTSKSGVLELFYAGDVKEKELLVAQPVPIPFRVDVLVGDEPISRGDAVTMIHRAFLDWQPIIQQLGVLDSDDPETQALRQMLAAPA